MDLAQPNQDIPTEQGAGDFKRPKTDNENVSNISEAENVQPKKTESRKSKTRSPTPRPKSKSKKEGVDNKAINENTSNTGESDDAQPKKKRAIRKDPAHPPTSEMVMESIKALKMRRGASVNAIRQHIEATYDVNMKVVEPHFKKFLRNGVDRGLLEQIIGAGDVHRYKIKKAETVKKENRNLKESQKKVKLDNASAAERKKKRPKQ